MMDAYCLKKDYKYVIYGAAKMGRSVLSGLRKAGYEVGAFLDKRAESIREVEGVPVFHPKGFVNEDRENTVVVIAIANPFEHPAVAKLLVGMGYKKIIYKMSANNQYRSECAQNLFDVLKKIINGLVNENTTVFECEDAFRDVYFEDAGMIKEAADEVVAYVPVELCYMALEINSTIPESEKRHNPDTRAFWDTPVLFAHKWAIGLFRGFEGYGNVNKSIREFEEFLFRNPWQYNTFPRTKQGIEDLIINRYRLFVQMSQLLNRGMEFFINTPIKAIWNDKGYFNIIDGGHRVCFFIAKGLPRIPAKMTRADYKSWINEDKLKSCIDFLKENDCPPAHTPILHPNFYNYPTCRDMAGILRIQHIFEYFKNKNICVRGLKVLEVGSHFSYFAQFFYRMGADVTTVEYLKNSFELGRLFNDLFYCGGIKALLGDIAEIELPETYDISIMLTILYPYIGTAKGRAILRKIDKATGWLLLWESGDEAQKEKEFIMEETSFDSYRKIAETYGAGKVRELGVFSKGQRGLIEE